ncbi:XdhC family protein [Pseudonocardia sp.]|uniref:XdhC family protein n=1 Tax=Pseudonocardia sp. TaxID=60912 RepID=UPI0026192B7F|nr:XdhC family protein [Pseudonocardia sp.]
MTRADLLSRVDGLRTGRTPFVLATVVRAERPTSAKPGDCALVLADGTIDGFVGGVCAESTVRLESLRLLQAGESGLLRITPRSGDSDAPDQEGVRTVGNPCLSGGTLEIFLEAMIPAALVYVHGEAPVARALARVGHALDWDVRPAVDPAAPIPPDTSAVVVASHGRDEAAVLAAALKAGVPYVALVASRRRSAGVREELAAMGVPEPDLERVHAPAGLDIGARTAPEIALTVFAEIVAHRPRVHAPEGTEPTSSDGSTGEEDSSTHVHAVEGSVEVAVDPVCGMDVAMTPASISARHGSTSVYFCGTGCRQAFLDDPQRFRT